MTPKGPGLLPGPFLLLAGVPGEEGPGDGAGLGEAPGELGNALAVGGAGAPDRKGVIQLAWRLAEPRTVTWAFLAWNTH